MTYWSNGVATLYQADARTLPLADASVDTVVTSPPYFGLRDYHTEGQIGLEASVEDYVATLVAVFREVWRVLKPTGTVWLNLGDSYASGGEKQTGRNDTGRRDVDGFKGSNGYDDAGGRIKAGRTKNLKPKDLVGIPWRVAFALQADGWYLRSDIIWSKPNPMPESCTDRPTKAHEYVFLLAKQERYFYDADAVREPNAPGTFERFKPGEAIPKHKKFGGSDRANPAFLEGQIFQANGRNRRSVWEIATQAYPEAHFATFPEALVEPCILAGTSAKGCCPECGKPWERVVERESVQVRPNFDGKRNTLPKSEARLHSGGDGVDRAGNKTTQTTGWKPTCKHDAEPVPCTVLDPFAGSGTTLAVAQRLGRHSVGVDISEPYLKLARKRLEAVSLPMML